MTLFWIAGYWFTIHYVDVSDKSWPLISNIVMWPKTLAEHLKSRGIK